MVFGTGLYSSDTHFKTKKCLINPHFPSFIGTEWLDFQNQIMVYIAQGQHTRFGFRVILPTPPRNDCRTYHKKICNVFISLVRIL